VVEQFAQDTFNRADNAMRANKATRQTADTYQAAATFFELLEIWGPLEPEVHKKIKFGKFHALRIAKALKNGEDPNLTNPTPEPTLESIAPPLDPNDPEVMALNGNAPNHRQPSVIEVPDVTDSVQAGLAPQSLLNESIHPSRASSVPPPGEETVFTNTSTAVSPMPKDTEAFYSNQPKGISPISPDRKSSTGGNYFPQMPSSAGDETQPDTSLTLPSAPETFASQPFDLPPAPTDNATDTSGPDLPLPPTTFAMPQPTVPKTALDSFMPPPIIGQSPFSSIPPVIPQVAPQPHHVPQSHASQPPLANTYSPVPTPSNSSARAAFVPPPAALPQPASLTTPHTNVVVDEAAMLKAQKHAKWAISALNFEDVPTAIREFQAALQTLGAR